MKENITIQCPECLNKSTVEKPEDGVATCPVCGARFRVDGNGDSYDQSVAGCLLVAGFAVAMVVILVILIRAIS